MSERGREEAVERYSDRGPLGVTAMEPNPDGPYVRYSDYAALRSQIERELKERLLSEIAKRKTEQEEIADLQRESSKGSMWRVMRINWLWAEIFGLQAALTTPQDTEGGEEG